MKKGMVVVIEGVSNTGKTTTCEILRNNNWVVIPECAEFMENPPKSSKNYEEEINNQKRFFEAEIDRLKKAKEFSDHRK